MTLSTDQTLAYSHCERTADARVRPLFSRLMCKDIKVWYRNLIRTTLNAPYRGPFFLHSLRNSDTQPPATASRARIASRARMPIRHSSSTSFFLGFLFHTYSSCGVVFNVGLLRENISLLARTFLSINRRRYSGCSQPAPVFPRCRHTLRPRWDFATWSGRW